MTALQVTINNLKESVIAAEMILAVLESTQKDLEKPPPHKWEHGDIFKTPLNIIMIYLKFAYGPPRTVSVVGPTGGLVEQQYFNDVLRDAKFLFNIKEKL